MDTPQQDRLTAVYAWIQANQDSNRFAASLSAARRRFGSLTPGQIDAVWNRNLAPKAATANVAGEGFTLLMLAFQHARTSGLKYPKVHGEPEMTAPEWFTGKPQAQAKAA